MAPNTATSREKWLFAAGLTVVADVAGTLATFMPMKSVFILAADDIPSFFPQPLIQAGPAMTAVALVGIAGLLAVVSGVAKRTSESLAEKSEVLPKRPGRNQSLSPRSLTLREFATLALVLVLVPAAAFVSVTFTLLVLGWLGAIASTLAILIHRRVRRPPYTTGRAEFAAEFKQWVEKTALWATVAAAIVTLLLSFPALGLTGILLGAILLRRLQSALGSVGHVLLPRWGRNDRAAETSANASTTTAPTGAPLDFLASQTGQRLLRLSLERLSLSPSDWQLIGLPNRNQASLLAREEDTELMVLLRVFASDKTELRETELEFRQEPFDSTPFVHSTAERETIAGLPAILVRFSKDHQPDPATTLTAQEAAEWQVTWEIACIEDKPKQKFLRQSAFDDPNDFLLPHLKVMASIRGPHQTTAREYLSRYEELRAAYLSGPPVQEIGAPVSHQNLLPVGCSPEPIDCTNLKVSPIGASWGTSSRHKDTYFSRSENPSLAQLAKKVMTRQDTTKAARACRARNIREILPPLNSWATDNQSHKPSRAPLSPQTSGLNKDQETLVELAKEVARKRWGSGINILGFEKIEIGRANVAIHRFFLNNGESLVRKATRNQREARFAEAALAFQSRCLRKDLPIIEHLACQRSGEEILIFTHFNPALGKIGDWPAFGEFVFDLHLTLREIETKFGPVVSEGKTTVRSFREIFEEFDIKEPRAFSKAAAIMEQIDSVPVHNDLGGSNLVRSEEFKTFRAIDFGSIKLNAPGADFHRVWQAEGSRLALDAYCRRASLEIFYCRLSAELEHSFQKIRSLKTRSNFSGVRAQLEEMVDRIEQVPGF